MNPRVFAFTLAGVASAILLALPAAAQAQNAAAKTASSTKAQAVARGADGHPDLSGVYTNQVNTPMQRPANLGAKEFYANAAEEAAELQQQRAGRGGRGGGNGQLAVHYDTSQFGLGPGQGPRSASLRTSIITGPEGRIPPLTPEALKRQAERRAFNAAHQWDGPEDRPLGERCIMWPSEGPPMLPEGYNSDLQIVQGEGYVAIMQEMIHDVRMIPTDGRPHLPSSVRQWFGDSRGHWEGDTLVVETTNYTDRTTIQNAPITEQLKVTERFTRIDPNTIRYQFTVDDPGTWTKPWSGELNLAKINSPIYEYACQEGNYGMANNLSGARATERKAAEAKKAGGGSQ